MNNVSTTNYTNFAAQTGRARGGLGQPGARAAVLQTVTALSFAGPRRVAPGGRRKRATGTAQRLSQTSSVARQVHAKKHAGVRVRETAASAQRATTDAGYDTELRERRSAPLSRKKRKKAGRAQQLRPACARSGSVLPAGSLRQQRRAGALDDFVVAPGRRKNAAPQETDDHASQRTRGSASCNGAWIPLGRDNFTRIKDDLDGCYRLVKGAVIDGDQTRSLPIGNSTHPFTGRLEGGEHLLHVNWIRPQGDALLFGAIRDSSITLAVGGSQLETRNGSRAALIGEMQEANSLRITRFHNNRFAAAGAGTAEVGLVARTVGARNEVRLERAFYNSLSAQALPPSAFCSPPCLHRAVASLGLGTIAAGGPQSIVQHRLGVNWLYARASFHRFDTDEMGQGPANSSARASVAALGLLGDPAGAQVRIASVQELLHGNSLTADADNIRSTAGSFAAEGHACASLGYGDLGCSAAVPVPAEEWLWVAQINCRNNVVRASSLDASLASRNATGAGELPPGVARASLVSSAAVHSLQVQHRNLEGGILQAVAHRGEAERILLGPARQAQVRLYSGGLAGVPLFSRRGARTQCMASSLIDRAGYQAGNLRCEQPYNATGQPDSIVYNSLEPDDWRQLHDSLRLSEVSFPTLASVPLPCAFDGGLHYPNEVVQALTPGDSQWLLVTRQRYPFRRENDLNGLLRVSRFRLPGPGREPSGAQQGGALLYQPPANGVLQRGVPVQALVQDETLHLLYQEPGKPVQLASLSLNGTNATHLYYELNQYNALAGQARLLSVEDEGLYLWMQQDDTVLAYSLANRADNSSSRLRGLVDLSGQPGGTAVLARDGHWLYSLRLSEAGYPRSLRRAALNQTIDPHWPGVWKGTGFVGRHLILGSDGRLRALPWGALQRSRGSDSCLQAYLPEGGGCLRWLHVKVTSQKLPATAGTRFSDAPAAPAAPTSGNDSRDGAPLPTGLVTFLSFVGAGLCVLLGFGVFVSVGCSWERRQVRPERHDLRPEGRLMVMSRNDLSVEIPAREQAVVEEAQRDSEFEETSL